MGELKNVEHPSHYNRNGGMECIDEMLLIFGQKAVEDFCLCNAWKYRYRAADKNGAEDLAKSDWYLRKYKELKENARNELKENAKNALGNSTLQSFPYWNINGENKPEPV